MTRVLIVHNRYRSTSPSGENRVVERDIAALSEAGAEVRTYLQDSDDISELSRPRRVELAGRPVYSFTDTRRITRILDEWKPNVVHLHNPYPLISPAFIGRARARRIPVVQTVHNYRHVCMDGLYSRAGLPCHDCAGRRFALPGVRHGCYRGSRAQSAVMMVALSTHRGAFRGIDRFIALNETLVRYLVEDLGVDRSRVAIRPNSLLDPGPPVEPSGSGFLYVGRLDEPKGVSMLMDAWGTGAPAGWHLTIAGDGSLRSDVESFAASRADVTFTGPVDADGVRELMDANRVVLVPSVWREAMPMVVVEAFSRGRPVLGTGHGSLAEIVDPTVGWLCEPNVDSLRTALNTAATGVIPPSAGPRARFDEQYRGDEAAQWLLDEYSTLVADGR